MDGLNVVKKYHKFCGKLKNIFLTSEFSLEHPELAETHFTDSFEIVTKEEMSKVVGYKYHRGVIGVGAKPQFQNLNTITGNAFILNGVVQAENIGSICRSLAAFNIDNLIIDSKSCHPFIRRAIRVSMGNVFKLNVYRVDSVGEAIETLKQKAYQVLAADYRPNSKSLKDVEIHHPVGIIIGSEGHGIDPEYYAMADTLVKIDVDHEVEYLNASVATSVLAFYLSLIK